MGKTKNDYKKLHDEVMAYRELHKNYDILSIFNEVARDNGVSPKLVDRAYYSIKKEKRNHAKY